MTTRRHSRGILVFFLRFLVLVSVFVVLWWLFIPYYGYLLVQLGGGIARYLLGVPVEAGRIQVAGLLNTESLILFRTGNSEPASPVGMLVTNLPVFVALIAATSRLTWRRRLASLTLGCAILFLGHVVWIVVSLRFPSVFAPDHELPNALIQLFLTLPFLLWIVLGYGERLVGFISGER